MHRHNDAISSLIAVVTSIGALLIDVAPSIAQAPPPTSRETAPISFTLSGDTLGLGKWWARLPFVRAKPWLR